MLILRCPLPCLCAWRNFCFLCSVFSFFFFFFRITNRDRVTLLGTQNRRSLVAFSVPSSGAANDRLQTASKVGAYEFLIIMLRILAWHGISMGSRLASSLTPIGVLASAFTDVARNDGAFMSACTGRF